MLATLRKKLGTGILLAILGIGLIAIVITGFGTDGLGGLGSGGSGKAARTVARVGDERLTDIEISQLIDGRYRQLVRQQPTLDRAQFVDTQFAPLLDRIVSDNAVVAFGRQLGFVVPQRMVDQIIVGIPAFQNVAGGFDDAAFRAALQGQNLSERQLRDDLASGEIMRMVLAPVSGEVRTPRAVAAAYASLLLEGRRGGLGAVPTQLMAQNLNPNDEEIAAFYQQNLRAFALPERRVLRYALFGRDHFGDAIRATDEEVAAYYAQNQAQFGPSETRNLQRVILPDEAAARAFVERVRGGMGFADAAGQAGFAAGDINFPGQSREQFTGAANPEVAAAAFGADQGAVLGPFRTELGFQVVRVDAINRTPQRPLQNVRPEITAAIEARKLAEQVTALSDRVQERLTDGASFEEIATAERLNVQTTPPVTATGQAPGQPANQPYQFPTELAPLLQAAFDLAPDDDPLIEQVEPEGQAALVGLVRVEPPAPPPLAQIRDQVRTQLIQRTALGRARAVADGIVARINGGMAPAQAYAQAGLQLPPPRNVEVRRLQIAQPGQQVPPPLRLLFSIPQGRARVLPAPNGGGWIIVHHLQRTAGDAARDPRGGELISTVQQGFDESIAAEIQEQFTRAVAAATTISRDEEQIGALRQRMRAGQ